MTHPTPIGNSLRIYMPSDQAANYIDCWCTRWDEDSYSVVVESFMDSANRNLLFSHVVPGAWRELYSVLGKPKYIDTTYQKQNTLYLQPLYGYGLSGVRKSREVVVKSISDNFSTPDILNVKIEAIRLDVQ